MSDEDSSPLLAAVTAGDVAAVAEAAKNADALASEQQVLPLAASLGNVAVVEALLAAGATAAGRKGGWSAASHAAAKGHADVLAALIAQFGPGCLAAHAGSSLTPLLLAAQYGQTACAALVLDAAPDALRAEDASGRNALMLAACAGSVPLIELLVSRGLAVDGAGEVDGRTALMWAIISHRPDAVGALARLGADPTVRAKINTEQAVVPGKPEPEGDAALDLAEARHGKDPTLRHLAAYVRDWLKKRSEEPGAPAPPMPPLPWVSCAEAFVARGGEEAAAVEVAPTGESDKSAVSDIFDDDDAEEEAKEVDEAPAAEEKLTEKNAATAAMAVAAASAADLDELD